MRPQELRSDNIQTDKQIGDARVIEHRTERRAIQEDLRIPRLNNKAQDIELGEDDSL